MPRELGKGDLDACAMVWLGLFGLVLEVEFVGVLSFPLLTVLFEHPQSLQKFGSDDFNHDHGSECRRKVADRSEVGQQLEDCCNGERLLFFIREQDNY